MEKYRWSSYNEYVSVEQITNTNFILTLFSEDRNKAIEMFIQYNQQKEEKYGIEEFEIRKKLTDEELREKTREFKKRLSEGETLDDLLPEAFAAVREAAKRVLGMEHYRVQIIGGIILHQGRIAEMKTGEGKTLVSTLPAYLNALEGRGVHIVTVND